VTSELAAAPTPAARPAEPRFVIRPSVGWNALRLDELWAFRDLIYFMVWRDLKVRYKQTVLGAAWAVIQPLLTMAVFATFFGRLAKVPSDGVPYTLFCYTALVPWTFFATAISAAASSLISNTNLLKKVYFPRLILPVSSVGGVLVDLAISFVVLLALLVLYGRAPSLHALWVPVILLLALITATGAGLWLSAVNVQFRDVRYAVPFLIQFWMFSTPIAYPSSLIKNPTLKLVYSLNPMTGVVEGMRWALLGTNTAPGGMVAVSAAISLAMLFSGAYYFRRVERRFADVA
jgi:lipopolysaccharide transport system permease protein